MPHQQHSARAAAEADLARRRQREVRHRAVRLDRHAGAGAADHLGLAHRAGHRASTISASNAIRMGATTSSADNYLLPHDREPAARHPHAGGHRLYRAERDHSSPPSAARCRATTPGFPTSPSTRRTGCATARSASCCNTAPSGCPACRTCRPPSSLPRAEADRALLRFYAVKFSMARPLVAPPEVPAERLAALRAAFDATMKDPQYLEEAQRIGLDVNPLGGDGDHEADPAGAGNAARRRRPVARTARTAQIVRNGPSSPSTQRHRTDLWRHAAADRRRTVGFDRRAGLPGRPQRLRQIDAAEDRGRRRSTPDRGSVFVQPGASLRYLPQEPDFGDAATTLAYVEAGLRPARRLASGPPTAGAARPRRQRRPGPPLRRRGAPRRARPRAGAGAGHPAARRADQPSRPDHDRMAGARARTPPRRAGHDQP